MGEPGFKSSVSLPAFRSTVNAASIPGAMMRASLSFGIGQPCLTLRRSLNRFPSPASAGAISSTWPMS